jgi:hypothetical protein
MLKLRPAIVVETDRADAGAATPLGGPSGGAGQQRLVVELATQEGAGARRAAIADIELVGRAELGDEVIVNVQALDLGLGSGGFDVVHVNLTRGLDGEEDQGPARPHVMKLNYTSLQHAVEPVEDQFLQLPVGRPTGILALHGQLSALAWAFAQGAPGGRLGYVQTEGGALPGGHSRTVRLLRKRGLLVGHLTAGATFGGEGEAITTAGALHHGLCALGWDAAVCGPGPGIVGSSSALGHGGMIALDSAHVSLALGCSTLLVARMSSGDERSRHRGISHHTLTVLDLLLEPVTVALPAGMRSPVGSDLLAGLRSVGLGAVSGAATPSWPAVDRPARVLEVKRAAADRPARITRHDWRRAIVDLPTYASSGLPAETMGRGLAADPLFFAAALAGGSVLAQLVGSSSLERVDREDQVGEGA